MNSFRFLDIVILSVGFSLLLHPSPLFGADDPGIDEFLRETQQMRRMVDSMQTQFKEYLSEFSDPEVMPRKRDRDDFLKEGNQMIHSFLTDNDGILGSLSRLETLAQKLNTGVKLCLPLSGSCDENCTNGSRQCSVFDCQGNPIGSFQARCEEAVKYSCGNCVQDGQDCTYNGGQNIGIRYKYPVYKIKSGGQTELLEYVFSECGWTEKERECLQNLNSDPRCK